MRSLVTEPWRVGVWWNGAVEVLVGPEDRAAGVAGTVDLAVVETVDLAVVETVVVSPTVRQCQRG